MKYIIAVLVLVLLTYFAPIVLAQTIAPYPEAPLCAAHDPTAYHGLWNGVDGCHYDHTHYTDPAANEVAAIFGDYTVYTGQEVSYPWQTFMGASPGYPAPPSVPHYENEHKHAGYKFDHYDFASYGTCPVSNQTIRSVPNAWLIERHSLGDSRDFLARIHSFFAAVRFCIPGTNEVAYLYTGGWQDFGQRISPYQGTIIPLPDNPQPPYPSNRQPYIHHGCVNSSLCKGEAGNTSWISEPLRLPPGGGHRLFSFAFRGNDAIDAIDATNGLNNPNPTFVNLCTFYAISQGCRFDNTRNHTYAVIGTIPAEYDLLDGVDDDRVNYEGYTDRWGVVVQGCTERGLDCVPVKMVNLPVGKYNGNVVQYDEARFTPAHSDHALPEYDVLFNGVSSGWVGVDN